MGNNCGLCGFSNDPGAKFCGGCARSLVREGEVTHPRFVIGKKGRPYCAAHTYFDGRRLDEYDNEQLLRPHRPHSLACKSCEHYTKDDCYFSAPAIDAITENIFKRRVRCDFCIWWWVGSPVVSLEKIYFETTTRGKGYVVCEWWDHVFKTGEQVRKKKKTIAILASVLAFSVVVTLMMLRLVVFSPLAFVWGDISLITDILIVGVLGILLWNKWITLLRKWAKKRQNRENYLLDLRRGHNTKMFLAVD